MQGNNYNNLLTFRFPRPTSRWYKCNNRRPLKGKYISCNLYFLLNEYVILEIYVIKEALENNCFNNNII